ncbi:MAG: ATP-binding cassette domain-containing protein [Desulfatiglans sp.]|nr:ATP-binding cassette domain-containing protein [Thermodesulfobacteriota bacterium]MEE4352377.1 ATP-binding cassette domain-containing protein [Desulfatiglans sp.]
MIKIENLHASFDGNEVLKGISLDIKKGEVMALIGGSGSGKSVLLKHVAGLMIPDQGNVIINGQDMGMLKGKRLTDLRAGLGFLFQGGALFDSMTVFENVAFPLKEKTRLSDDLISERVLEALDNVGLSGAEHKFPSQISGGMVKRTALARALIMDPQIMLFDEPTTGLDPVMGQAILELIHSWHDRISYTGIIVTHEIPEIFPIVDRIAMLHNGVIRAVGTPEELMSSEDQVVCSFVGNRVRGRSMNHADVSG